MRGPVARYEDMSPTGRLELYQQADGDIIVRIVPDPGEPARYAPTAEFCAVGCGGGQSIHTRAALLALMDAMEKDNAGRPQHREE